jgi:SAM-dependent methyltransferase
VQDAAADIAFVRRVFRRRFGREPRLLREDFCGTALFACAWVRGRPGNRAWGIDLDPEPLGWGREHNVAALRPSEARRVRLVQGDVLDVAHERVDVTVAYNFSYFVFKTREQLVRYFAKARTTLRREGLFFVDLYGGADAQRRMTETRAHDGFDYVWDQDLFDPITHRAVNHIHFRFPDGSRMQRAFSYDWRLWTIPEVRDALAQAGFSSSQAYWERTDRASNEGMGSWYAAEHAADDPAWIAYVVASR